MCVQLFQTRGGLQPPGHVDIGNNPRVATYICEITRVEPE